MEKIFGSQVTALALTVSWAYLEKKKKQDFFGPCCLQPPTPVGKPRGVERERQTAPPQPTHTKLILTRNLR